MRQAGLLLALLAAATQLQACATMGSPDARRGQAGPVSWEIVDLRQSLEDNGTSMRWSFTFVFRNTGASSFDFERVEIGSRAGGPSDDVTGGMETVPFARRLETGSELRVGQKESWGCRQCAPGHLPRLFSEGVIVYYTFFGQDGAGSRVRVPIAMRFDSSVGTRE